jgi:hypothetical protein
MKYGAIDLQKHESQIRIVKENGEIGDYRIATTRDRFTALFWGRLPMRILLEASTEPEWVAQHLELSSRPPEGQVLVVLTARPIFGGWSR